MAQSTTQSRERTCVLVVDEHRSVTDALSAALRFEGFETRAAHDGRTAVRAIEELRPDLVVLDVMLPDLDGFEVARRLREGRRIPVIFLTARDATDDKVAGLEVADDYVTKPFSLAEMVARVRAVLRRTGADEEVLVFDDLLLNEQTHEVWRAGRPVELTPTEFNLLRFFMLNPRRILSKRQIIDHVWHGDAGDPNVVETYVSYLRKKLGPGPALIQTVRLVGYALRRPV